MQLLVFTVATLIVLATPIPGHDAAAQSRDIEGCYRADRPLGTSAGSVYGRVVAGEAGRRIGEDTVGLSRLTSFRLLAGGRVERPGTVMSEWWAIGSRWVAVGDTLRVTLSTRPSGWVLRLVRDAAGDDSNFIGVARYLSDVVVRDTSAFRAPQVIVQVHRERCAPTPDGSRP